MNTSYLPPSPATNRRRGITLLEVLIAAGVLVVGLTSVLAIIPAAGSLFGEASMSDRAAALASNAAADMRFRGLFQASDFGATVKTVVYASDQGTSPVLNAAAFAGAAFTRNPLPSPDPLADDEAYGRAGYAAVCSPLSDSDPYAAGAPARVTIIVFKSRAPEREEISLTKVSAGVYKITGGSVYQQEDRRKRLMPPCSWVAVQKDSKVRWLHVGSSWATFAPGGTTANGSYVAFTDAEAADAAIVNTVSAFAGVLRVEDQIIELD